jgi:hypothetical protein
MTDFRKPLLRISLPAGGASAWSLCIDSQGCHLAQLVLAQRL